MSSENGEVVELLQDLGLLLQEERHVSELLRNEALRSR